MQRDEEVKEKEVMQFLVAAEVAGDRDEEKEWGWL